MTGTFAYPGSKTTYAGWIIDHFPEHHLYVEPFGGAASILVAKSRSDIEVYNDLNGDCVRFFKAVRDKPSELARWVEYTPYSRELFEQYVESYPEWPNDTIEKAGRFLFIQSAAFGGKGVMSGSPTFSVAKGDSERSWCNEVKWDSKSDHIKQIAKRFKSVNIEQLDYAKLVEKYDHEDAFFYFDPPYIDVGNDYYQVEDGGFDHERFTETVLDMDAKWPISYDHNIPERLQDFHSVKRTKTATMSAQNPEKVETLTMNYDPETTAMFSEAEQETLF